MALGVCNLWYDAQSLLPLGYTLFMFEKNARSHPFFHFGATRFAKSWHILKIARVVRKAMGEVFKNRVRAYISPKRIEKFAAANGFVRRKTPGLWDAA